ncbi:MAG: tyrosine-type recombinase/integrase [Pseudorhodoplanes sp.]
MHTLAPGYHWDAALPSFGVYRGTRTTTFVLVRTGGRRIKIGRYPTLSLKEARRRAHGLISSDEAPIDAISVEDALEAYFASLTLRKRTVSDYKRLIGRLRLKGMVSKLTAHGLLTEINRFKKTPQEARHLFFAVSAFLTWCKQRSLIRQHPLLGARCPYTPKSRSRILTDDEIRSVWKATWQLSPLDTIVRLCFLTGQRRTECSLFCEEWVSGETLTIPAEISKNHQEHTIPFSQDCLDLLEWLSPKFNGWGKEKVALDTRSGVHDWVLHDIRRTFSTIHARIGTPPHVTEALLNHKTGTLTPLAKIYNQHKWQPEMRCAMQSYWAHLSRLLSQVASS